MESKVKEAAERKQCGYNCAQAVACTYCRLAGMDEETARNLAQGFAVGIGGSMEGTCGAIIGAVSVLGAINKDPQKTMQGSRRIIGRFKEQNGTVICRELKGIADGVVKRECIDCVKDAASLLEDELARRGHESFISSSCYERDRVIRRKRGLKTKTEGKANGLYLSLRFAAWRHPAGGR